MGHRRDEHTRLDDGKTHASEVLLVSARAAVIDGIGRVLDGTSITVRVVDDPIEPLCAELAAGVALIDAESDDEGLGMAAAIAAELSERDDAPVCVVIADRVSTADALELMRSGVSDVLSLAMPDAEVRARLAGAVERAAARRRGTHEIERLRNLCGKLERSRRALSGRVGGLCDDLVSAYRDLSDRVGDVSLASEVNSLFRQELDIESLLRTLMETILAKVGPTNAVVFLPDSSGEYSVGAYINHDCARSSAEAMLDHLACTMPQTVEARGGIVRSRAIDADPELVEELGEPAHWLRGSALFALSCESEGEVLGVLVLFRDAARGFDDTEVRTVDVIAPLFAAQLGRVIRVHHRHIPETEWGFETGEDDEYGEGGDLGMAA